MSLTVISIAAIGFVLGAYLTFRRMRARYGIAPASRLRKEFGLYAENRPVIRLDPIRVPADLRQLIPYAEKWGTGDDIIRNDVIDKASEAEKRELHDALLEADERITAWLNSIRPGELSDEAAAFMHMQEALAEMGYFLDEEKSGQPSVPAVEPPRHIGAKKVDPIPAELFAKLKRITPSRNRDMSYYPCRVTTRDGRVFERVYVQSREPFVAHWGILPFDDRHKGWIAISEIVDLEESPLRLPPHLAEKVYEKGESGMGHCIFRVDFRNGHSRVVITGNAVDFIPLPDGITGADVVRVHPQSGRIEQTDLAPRYYWSIYDGVAGA